MWAPSLKQRMINDVDRKTHLRYRDPAEGSSYVIPTDAHIPISGPIN